MGKVDAGTAPAAGRAVLTPGSPALRDLVAAIAAGTEARER